jgi:hypothetical protein
MPKTKHKAKAVITSIPSLHETLPVLTIAEKHHRKFEAVFNELAQLHKRKSLDYGSNVDPLANIRASREFGVRPWVGALVRLNDKVHRLKVFAVRGTLANEGAEDSLKDIVVYATIALQLFREQLLDESTE